jgi:HEAT repeat protein
MLDEADGDSLEPALALAAKLLPEAKQALPAARKLARAGLASPSEGAKVQAILLCQQPGVGMLDEVARLLKGGTPAVRQAAVLAVGPSDAHEEALLCCLHDEDAEVRRLASAALQGRGLRPEQVELGRLITHAEARTRLRVLDKLREVGQIDPVEWVRRLSRDPSPAVRAAAVRVITESLPDELGGRVEEMARTDPSPTVAQLAHYYLGTRGGVRHAGGRR